MAVKVQRLDPATNTFVTVRLERATSVKFEEHAGQLVAQGYTREGTKAGAVVNPAAVLD